MRDDPNPTNDKITQALAQAYRQMLHQHRLAGMPVVVSENGKILYISAEDIERELDATCEDPDDLSKPGS